jgi:hypothetical protein
VVEPAQPPQVIAETVEDISAGAPRHHEPCATGGGQQRGGGVLGRRDRPGTHDASALRRPPAGHHRPAVGTNLPRVGDGASEPSMTSGLTRASAAAISHAH